MRRSTGPAASSTLGGYERWPVERVDELTDLVLEIDPNSAITPDDLLCLWPESRKSIVLGAPGAAVGGYLDGPIARLTLLGVSPTQRRARLGSEALAAFEMWCLEEGASAIEAGAPAGQGPWPGVAEDAGDLQRTLRSSGFVVSDEPTIRCVSLETRFRVEASTRFEVSRALSEPDARAATLHAERCDEHNRALVALAIEQGTCLVARPHDSTEIAALLCHSVVRSGWIGPLVVVGDRHHDLVPTLLGSACLDLMVAGRTMAHVCPGTSLTSADLERVAAVSGPTFVTAAKPLTVGGLEAIGNRSG